MKLPNDDGPHSFHARQYWGQGYDTDRETRLTIYVAIVLICVIALLLVGYFGGWG